VQHWENISRGIAKALRAKESNKSGIPPLNGNNASAMEGCCSELAILGPKNLSLIN